MRWSGWALAAGFAAVLLTGLSLPPSTRAGASQETAACLHGANENPEQLARRREAIAFTRHVNTIQATAKPPVPQAELPLTLSIPQGFELHLVSDAKAYSFSVIDTTDPCRFGFFSNEAGLIYQGQALR